MRQTDYSKTMAYGTQFLWSQTRRVGILCLLLLVISSKGIAQSHDHEDTLIALPQSAISITMLQNSSGQIKFDIVNNGADSIKPFFVEIFAIGFDFSDDCILQQSINNLNLESNLEKLWGSQFISLGVGTVPPSGHYATTLGLAGSSQGGIIKFRVFGTINGKNVTWTGYLKK